MNELDFSNFSSFRELDVQYAQSKGWAFKQFKSIAASLIEGQDYLWFHQQEHAELIAALRSSGRIYASTVNLVLLSPSGISKFNQLVGAEPGKSADKPAI